MGFFSWLFGNDYDETSVPAEPRLSSGEFEKGFAEIKGLVAAEEERLRLKREAEERTRKLREADERERAQSRDNISKSPQALFMRNLSLADMNFDNVNSLVERNMTFGRKLARYVQERCEGKASICYQRAGVSRHVYSKIISDSNKTVTKRTALQLCIGLKLNRTESEGLLRLAGYSLAPSSFEDTAFAWCLEHGAYNMTDINEFLVRAGEEPIRLN